MTKSTLGRQVAAYVAAVRAALHDLPDEERDEATRDLEAHLTEVVGELGADADAHALRDRLGPPEAYAAQLREAAGLGEPGAEGPPGRPKQSRLVIGYVVYVLGVVTTSYAILSAKPPYDERSGLSVLGFAATLAGVAAVLTAIRDGQPPWLRRWRDRQRAGVLARVWRWLAGPVWVLRGFGANILLAMFMQQNGVRWDSAFTREGGTFHFGGLLAGQHPPWDYFTYWPFFQDYIAGTVLVISVVVSIWLGIRGRKRRRESRILAGPVNLVLLASIAGPYLFGQFPYA